MRKYALLLFSTLILNNSPTTSPVMAASPVEINTLRPIIFLMNPNPRSEINVRVTIKIQNTPDNRTISLECNPLGPEGNYTKTVREYLYEDGDPEYSTITERFFHNNGLTLPRGEYELRAVLTRNTKGEKKEFSSTVKVLITSGGDGGGKGEIGQYDR